MNVIVGFGSIEQQQREDVYHWLDGMVKELCKQYNWESEMEELEGMLKLKLEEYQKRIQDDYDQADTSIFLTYQEI